MLKNTTARAKIDKQKNKEKIFNTEGHINRQVKNYIRYTQTLESMHRPDPSRVFRKYCRFCSELFLLHDYSL
jgi:hypothetical protein